MWLERVSEEQWEMREEWGAYMAGVGRGRTLALTLLETGQSKEKACFGF